MEFAAHSFVCLPRGRAGSTSIEPPTLDRHSKRHTKVADDEFVHRRAFLSSSSSVSTIHASVEQTRVRLRRSVYFRHNDDGGKLLRRRKVPSSVGSLFSRMIDVA